MLLIFAGSGPFSLVCSPLAWWSWRQRLPRRTTRGARVAPLIVVIGAVIQFAYLLWGSRTTGGAAGYGMPTPAEIVHILALHGVCNSFLGKNFTFRHFTSFPFWAILAAGAILPGLAFLAVRLRNVALMVLLGLAGASVAVAFLFPLSDPRLMLNPNFATRYFFFTMVFILVTMLAMAERGRWWRWGALPGLTLALVVGTRGDFLVTAAPDTHWPDQIAVFRSLKPGTDFYIPVYPQPSAWGLTLRKKEPTVDSRMLDKYPISAGRPR